MLVEDSSTTKSFYVGKTHGNVYGGKFLQKLFINLEEACNEVSK